MPVCTQIGVECVECTVHMQPPVSIHGTFFFPFWSFGNYFLETDTSNIRCHVAHVHLIHTLTHTLAANWRGSQQRIDFGIALFSIWHERRKKNPISKGSRPICLFATRMYKIYCKIGICTLLHIHMQIYTRTRLVLAIQALKMDTDMLLRSSEMD